MKKSEVFNMLLEVEEMISMFNAAESNTAKPSEALIEASIMAQQFEDALETLHDEL